MTYIGINTAGNVVVDGITYSFDFFAWSNVAFHGLGMPTYGNYGGPGWTAAVSAARNIRVLAIADLID